MSTTNPTHETVSTDDAQPAELSDRDIRALLTPMTVIDNCGDVRGAEGMFEVTTDSGSEYIVNLGTDSCTCPDHEYRGVRCKHIRRCEFEVGVTAIPGDVNLEALDDQLGEHVTTGQPRVAMTDGGVAADESMSLLADVVEGDEDRKPILERPNYQYGYIGEDAEGRHHHYDRPSETIYVTSESWERVLPDGSAFYWIGLYGDCHHTEDLSKHDGKGVKEWVQYVGASVDGGWESQPLDLTAAMNGALEDATEILGGEE